MTTSTREDLLQSALKLFAEKGFYGASIAQIARELGLTKQALLHHFGTKEKLYGEVLALINDSMTERLAAVPSSAASPEERFEQVFMALYGDGDGASDVARLVMRELMDNVGRADQARSWYLKPFLEMLIKLARDLPGNADRSDGELLAVTYQLLGAINYYALSQTTLEKIFGAQTFGHSQDAFPGALRALIRAAATP
ncbi:CerR family C-terminal domain-containing protein [Pyruvatibacter mobilis]|uniref:CerR family C-terminal domain-containing protein n=1 Tax=Pyruvatibacter mobilis TaxID=1712261 RepID=A0A845QDL0_9HYPH|nr:TetR/AcrR family transcriptional regulator [Pyruvatibacter mobilis]NBG96517.1 CerR family C-terminal domain-containing protein [Pyruvatibacter mobilis]QJD74593.1 CerR family C-terminal domain-containing protein [Pyruvatibacter mobilis]GGD08455.1 hypothetical protein GCM10011587_10420 [Pyruvatibacter mobilis]